MICRATQIQLRGKGEHILENKTHLTGIFAGSPLQSFLEFRRGDHKDRPGVGG